MKKVNYKGVELEVPDPSTFRIYNEAGEYQTEFKTAYVLDGLAFLSLEEVDKYLAKQRVITEYEGVKIYRALPKSRGTVVYSSNCSSHAYDTINGVKNSIDFYNAKEKSVDKMFSFDFQNIKPKLKNENPNQFYFYEKIFKRRKQKYMEYLEIECGYKVREKGINNEERFN